MIKARSEARAREKFCVLDGGEGEGQAGRSVVSRHSQRADCGTHTTTTCTTNRKRGSSKASSALDAMQVGGESGEVTSIIPLVGASTSTFGSSLGRLDDLDAAPVLLHGHVAVPCCCPRTDLPVCKQQPSHQQRQAGQHEQVEGIG